jgi:hypothetical protein
MKVLSPLRRKTIAKVANGSNLEYEVRQFRRLSSYELVHENNIAKNHETLVSLGLDKSFDEMMAMKRKPGEKKGGGRQAKRARKGDGGEYNGEDSDEEEEDEDATLAERIPCVQRAKPAAKSPAVKDWVKKAETNLEKDTFGPRWTELVSQWYLHEQQNGFVCPVRVCIVIIGELTCCSDEESFGKASAQGNWGVGAEGENREPGHQGRRAVCE